MSDGVVKIKVEDYVFMKDYFGRRQDYYVEIPVPKVICKLRGWLNRELPATPEEIGLYINEMCHEIALEMGLIKTPFCIYDIKFKPRYEDHLFLYPCCCIYLKDVTKTIDSRRKYKSFLTFCKYLSFDIRVSYEYVGKTNLYILYSSICETGCKEFAERIGVLWYDSVEILIYAMRKHARNHKVKLRNFERLKKETLGEEGYRYLKLGTEKPLDAYYRLVDAIIAENSAKFIKAKIQ